MATLLRAPGGTGNADVPEELLKTFLDAGWVRVNKEGHAAKASPKGDTKAAPSTKAEWAALAVELGVDVDPKAGKPAIVEAVKAYQALIANTTPSDEPDDTDEEDADTTEDEEDDDGSSDSIDSK